MTAPPSSPAFVIGVSGHMDVPGEDREEILERLRHIFRWLREVAGASDEPGYECPPWWPRLVRRRADGSGDAIERPLPGLGLSRSRLVLLTSLAPGVDTLAARAAAEAGIEIRAPLPFPADLFRESTSFTDTDDPAAAVAEFDALLADPEHPADHFPVLLVSDLALPPGEREACFRADLKSANPARRRLRYRASGEYVAAQCHLLLALYQPSDPPAGPDAAGTEAIVRTRRTGPTPGILPAAHAFPWLDSGEVLHVHTRSVKRLPDEAARGDSGWTTVPARFLPPSLPGEEGEPRPEAEGLREADLVPLWESTRLFEIYDGRCAAASGPAADVALEDLIGLSKLEEAGLSSGGIAFLQGLRPIAAARASASEVAGKCDAERASMMRWMAVLAFAAAFLFHGFSHWHFVDKDQERTDEAAEIADPFGTGATVAALAAPAEVAGPSVEKIKNAEYWTTLGFLGVAILAVIVASWRFFRYNRRKRWWFVPANPCEWLRFDSRVIAEGLRIQFYWAATGIPASVAARYLQRQKSEIDWIRNAISSLSFPYERWQEGFESLPPGDRRLILGQVVSRWLAGQRHYFASKSLPRSEASLHRFHVFGWALTWAGLIAAAGLLVWKAFHLQDTVAVPLAALVFVLAGGSLLAWRIARPAKHGDDPGSPCRAGNRGLAALDCLARGDVLAVALIASGVAAALVALVPAAAWWTPDPKSLWIILIGTLLVGGAICVAWAEKLSLAEEVRQYRAMNQLFASATARARHLLASWNDKPQGESAAAGADPLAQLRTLLVEIGEEALDENAEWLLMHRSRPLEPFLAG